MKKLRKIIIYALNISLYVLSKLIPKNNNIWIFGAWFGEKYTDNSKYLFEYVNKNHPEIRAIWLSNNENAIELIRKKDYEVYKIYSLQGYYYCARSYFSFLTIGMADVNMFIPTKYIINLWHGNPLKKIALDDNISYQKNSYMKEFLRSLFFPFLKTLSSYTLLTASSETEAINLSSAFGKGIGNILITGLPRNDVFFQKDIKKNVETKTIIYMPTHRNEGELDIKKLFFDDIVHINNKLKELDITLYIKLHYYHMKNMVSLDYSNIKLLFDSDIEQDIYSIINQFDMLITDYSSIFFDFLLTDKPIIFASFDYDEYISSDRELYYSYKDVTPGPKCKNWNEVLLWIEKFHNNVNLYLDERIKIKDIYHQYQDGNFSKRVCDEIIELYL